jgi:hypothetical protein
LPVFERQYKELLTRELLRSLSQGFLPNLTEISSHLQAVMSKDQGTVYQFIPQAKRAVFNNKLVNQQLNAIEFDVHILNDEILDLIGAVARRLNYANLYHKVHSYELGKLEAILNSILFAFENADFYFLSAFDSFSDYSKTNVKASDLDIINLAEGAIALPYGGMNTQRVNTSHLTDKVSWPVTVIRPASPQSTRQGASTSFGDIFSDVVNGWLYEVTTDAHEDCTIEFTFPLAGLSAAEVEVIVNRFELVPFSSTAQRVVISFSTDDVNYKAPEGYEDGVLMTDQKLTYALDFISELIQFVRIRMTKTTPDEEVKGGGFVYRFGLKGFAAYTIGRKERARYQSKPFVFEGLEESISKISLKGDVSVPQGTAANFSVALADIAGDPVTSFLPVRPIDAGAKPGANEVVVFGTTEKHQSKFEAVTGAFSTHGAKHRGLQFYKYINAVLPPAIYSTASLIRGHRVWYRDKNIALSRTEVKDNYVTFKNSDIEQLYTVTTEIAIQRVLKNNIELIVRNDIYYISGIHNLIPNYSQQKSGTDVTPTYAIYRVEFLTDTPTKEFTEATNAALKIKLTRANFQVSGAKAPIVKDGLGVRTYVAGIDYSIETVTVGGSPKSTGFLTIIPFLQGGSIYVSTNATGTIDFAGKTFLDTNTITINDGIKSVTFELDNDTNITAGNIKVTIGANATLMGGALVTALAAQLDFNVTGSNSAGTVTLTNSVKGTTGNQTITKTGGGTFTVSGMSGGAGPTNLNLRVTTTVDSDLTYKVKKVSGKSITLEDIKFNIGDSFKVTYRYTPVPPNTIEKASVRVKENISTVPKSKFFTEGIDYTLDPATGGIQRLPNGAISDKGSVFVDFLFRNSSDNVETFLTWCFIDGDPIKIVFDQHSKLNSDDALGEAFLANTPGGLIDMTKAEASPVLGPGWVQFIVKSKNPDANKGPLHGPLGNLVDQVIQLLDVDKNRVFKEGGKYFSSILALRDPMTQVTLNRLKNNVLAADHTQFSIDDVKPLEPLMVLNFNPGTTNELYLKVPGPETAADVHPASVNEIFTLSWQSKIDNKSNGTSVIVRCDLSRDPGVDGVMTPKVFEYYIRASEL